MKQYEMFELRFHGGILTENYADIPLTAVFTCGDESRTVKGFYDGSGQYVVRFLPGQTGEYRWEISGLIGLRTGCPEEKEICGPDKVSDRISGSILCEPAGESAHGLVKAEATHFVFDDGTPYVPFGTTVYALAHQEDALVEKTLASLKEAPFNKIRMCVFPKHYDYNHNEPPFYPFEKRADGSWDTGRPDFAFWKRFEGILKRICKMGIQVDLILFHPYDRWGFDALSQTDNLRYLDYLLRRLSAFPGIWWSLANEYDLAMDHKSLADWEEIESFVAGEDPYGHLLSCHNCLRFWDASRKNITHASIQTKGLGGIPNWIRRYQKPVIIDECCYEGDLPHFWGSISGQEMVFRFWRCCASGAYCTHGETFLSDDDIVWWSRGGTLKGTSPQRIAFLRRIMESLPGPLEPIKTSLISYAQLNEEDLEKEIVPFPEETRRFVRTLAASLRQMSPADRVLQINGEHEYASRCGEDAYLWFYDRQCYGIRTLELPKEKQYRIECLDTWEMTRTLIAEKAAGSTTIRLPAKEGLAVLALRTD